MAEMAEKILDYGPKIGGAKKDLWVGHLSYQDTLLFTPEEKKKFIKKDEIWPRPDYRKMIDEGISSEICYFISELRKMAPASPETYDDEAIKRYIDTVSYIRDRVMTVKTKLEARDAMNDLEQRRYICTKKTIYGILRDGKLRKFGYTAEEKLLMIRGEQMEILKFPDEAKPLTGHNGEMKFMKKVVYGDSYETSYYDLGKFSKEDFKEGDFIVFDKRDAAYIAPTREEAEMYVKLYMKAFALRMNMNQDKNSEKKSKKRFVPRQLQFVERNGTDYLKEIYGTSSTPTLASSDGQMTLNLADENEEMHAKPEYFDEVFKAPSLEFGNWETQKDRQAGLDMAFNALMDLALVLDISPEDISFNGVLKFAFGSRGSGNARAHYEPLRQVINLTKPKGAGALAHEWGHALDHYIGKFYRGSQSTQLGSENLRDMPEPFKKLVESFKYKTVTEMVDKTDVIKAELEKQEKYLKFTLNNIRKLIEEGDETAVDRYESAVSALMENLDKANGLHYIFANSKNDYIEAISEIKKSATGHGLLKNDKKDISVRCATLHTLRESLKKAGAEMVTKKTQTDYYKGSLKIAETFARSGGYWESPEEMFARAFDCYVEDKLKERGMVSDYLTYFASDYGTASPRGEERKLFNKEFDELFEFLKKESILHERKKINLWK